MIKGDDFTGVRITAAVLAAACMSFGGDVYAKELVHVSAWAYNDVSNFTNEGLLPECFDMVTDYRVPVTTEQFCELIYNIGVCAGITNSRSEKCFIDSDNEAVNRILAVSSEEWNTLAEAIPLEGLTLRARSENEEEWNKLKQYYGGIYGDEYIKADSDEQFYVFKSNPQNAVRRGQAAVYLSRYYQVYTGTHIDEYPEKLWYKGTDRAEYEGIYLSKSCGIMDASENASEPMTIEQAIIAVYRLYQRIPSVPHADDAGLYASVERLVKLYDNGVGEYRLGNWYLIKRDGIVLKELETDIYKNVYCHGGVIAAQTYNGRTELYSLESGEMTANVECLVYGMDDGYIITKSSDKGPMLFGLCGYDGNIVLDAVYSMEELNYLRRSDFDTSGISADAASGWVYYSDWNDGGHMYRADSNGENVKLLCDKDCYNMTYSGGYIYFSVRGANKGGLFCIKEDGTGFEQISDGFGYVYSSCDNAEGVWYSEPIDGWTYYLETKYEPSSVSDKCPGVLMRVKHTDSGTVKETAANFEVEPVNRNADSIYFVHRDKISGRVGTFLLDAKGIRRISDECLEVYFSGDETLKAPEMDGVLLRDSDVAETESLYKMLLTDEMDDCIGITGNYTVYRDFMGNVVRLDVTSGNKEYVYPNAGLFRFGAVAEIMRDPVTGHLLKLDTEGRLCEITRCNSMYFGYVDNQG